MNYYFVFEGMEETVLGFVKENKISKMSKYSKNSKRDDIYICKIERVLESIDGYIIQLDKDNKACIENKQMFGDVKLGQDIIVQLYKETGENKLDKYTMNYSIGSKNLVYYPMRKGNRFSRKINKNELKKLKESIRDDFNGITFRTSSYKKNIDDLLAEYNSLKRIDGYINKQSKFLPIPRKIYSNQKNIFEFLEDDFEFIITNSKNIHNILKNYYDGKIILNEDYNYIYDENISNDLETLKNKEVFLEDGSNIVIEKTEALTVVDVNSRSNTDFLNINKLAVKEVFRQVELRNIQGIIVIDIINMKKNELEILKKHIETTIKKHEKIKFCGISNTGLLEFIKTGINVDF